MTVNLTDPIFNDEDKARAYFEEIRWPNGVTCTHCGNANSARIYSIAANPAKKIRAGLWNARTATVNSRYALAASWKAATFR